MSKNKILFQTKDVSPKPIFLSSVPIEGRYFRYSDKMYYIYRVIYDASDDEKAANEYVPTVICTEVHNPEAITNPDSLMSQTAASVVGTVDSSFKELKKIEAPNRAEPVKHSDYINYAP